MSFIGDETYISANWFIPQIEGLVFSLARADLFGVNESERNIISLGYSYKLNTSLP